MAGVMTSLRQFPVFEAPQWLASRIVANTPRVVHESWLDVVTAVARSLIEPRTAMGLLTSFVMVAWLGSSIGISTDLSAMARDPRAAYYGAYDKAVRSFYRAPLVTEIRSQIERIREIS